MCEKLTSRQIQSKNTYDKIYNIAIKLIQDHGFDNITVSEICESADVSVGSFYNHFKSKHDILNEIFKLADDYFVDVVSHKIGEGTTHDRIINFFNYYAKYTNERGLDFTNQLYMGKNNLFATKGRAMQQVLKRIIEEGQDSGEISIDMTSEEIVIYLFIWIRGVVYDWCLHDGSYDIIDAISKHIKILVQVL